ncbi:glycosyltransferase [Cystobacter fuscus]
MAGYLNRETPYGAYLYGLKEMLGAEHVRLLGRVSAAQLSACYATASVYLSMSRHEGFGVPLLEAMYRGVPVVAYGAAAVPETMGGAGVATLTNEPLEVARLLATLENNPALKQEMIAAQRARVARLGQEAVATAIREALQPFLAGPTSTPGPRVEEPAGVMLVCPGLAAFPEAPGSRLALRLAERLSSCRLLTLDPSPGPRSVRPGHSGWEARRCSPSRRTSPCRGSPRGHSPAPRRSGWRCAPRALPCSCCPRIRRSPVTPCPSSPPGPGACAT